MTFSDLVLYVVCVVSVSVLLGRVDVWLPLGKELLIRLTLCFLVMSICNFGHFPFWYLLLITPAPGHCLPFTFQQN